jgi:hypothetical protein
MYIPALDFVYVVTNDGFCRRGERYFVALPALTTYLVVPRWIGGLRANHFFYFSKKGTPTKDVT